MKKHLTKRILLTLLAVCIFIGALALLFGQFVIIEKDFFLDGEVAFIVRSFDGNRRVYATDEEAALVKDWLTTLKKMNSEYEEGFVMLNIPQIRIKSKFSAIFLSEWGDNKILVTIKSELPWSAAGKWVYAKSSDPELTQRVFEMCYAAVDDVESTLAPVWYE